MPALPVFCRLLLTLSLFSGLALSAEVQKPSLVIASSAESIVLRQGYSSNAVTVTVTELRKKLANEIALLEGHPWKQTTIIKHGACGHQVEFITGGATVLHLYVYPSKVFLAPRGTTRNPQFVAQVVRTELPTLRKLLLSLPPPSPCPDET